MNKIKWIFSPVIRIILAAAIVFGHILLALILFPLQSSITSKETEDILVSSIAGVRKSLAVSGGAVNAPEYAYLFTEYDSVGKDGGFIIADNLHDIHCGKRVESCRTLEDAGIDINKYKPLSIYQAEIFGVQCNFVYLRDENCVIVAYIPAAVQKSQRTLSVFAAVGSSLIVFTILFFLVPLLVQFLSRFSWFPPVSVYGTGEPKDSAGSTKAHNNSFVSDGLDDANSSEAGDESSIDSDRAYDSVTRNVPVDSDIIEDNITADVSTVADSSIDVSSAYVAGTEVADDEGITETTDADAEMGGTGDDLEGITNYVSRMEELKETAYKLGEERLFKMAAYLEKCGRAVLAGSKDSDRFMAEIESKTPIALKYYASVVPQQETEAVYDENAPAPEKEPDSSVAVESEETYESAAEPPVLEQEQEPESVAVDEPVASEAADVIEPVSEPVMDSVIEQKVDVSPAEIFAVLEALYAGAGAAEKNAVYTNISALRRINLPRKLNAVFPELEEAAKKNDYPAIMAVINSLRTGSRSN